MVYRFRFPIRNIYMNILKYNSMIKEAIATNGSPKFIEKNYQLLQYFVTMIANNKATGTSPIGQNSGRTFQCISSRLNTKNGRIRGNLMGKRVDFSARSVITGDPNLSITQLGVPMKIAKNITKPIIVNERNRKYLTRLIQNGPDVHPGANYVVDEFGKKTDLNRLDHDQRVALSQTLMTPSPNAPEGKYKIVMRQLISGDVMLANRQPTLHKPSIMAHVARVLPNPSWQTIRLHYANSNTYNADFDVKFASFN